MPYLSPLEKRRRTLLKTLVARREDYYSFIDEAKDGGQTKRLEKIFESIHDLSVRINRMRVNEIKRKIRWG